jgi:hypothetical protein
VGVPPKCSCRAIYEPLALNVKCSCCAFRFSGPEATLSKRCITQLIARWS